MMSKTKDNQGPQTPSGESGKLTLGGGKGTLSLKGNLGTQVRQNMGQGGRGGNVAVEVRRKRSGPERPEAGAPDDDARLTNDEREMRARVLRAALADGGQKKPPCPSAGLPSKTRKKKRLKRRTPRKMRA